MKKEKEPSEIQHYSFLEETINIYSHVLGLLSSGFALVLLLWKASRSGDVIPVISAAVFGISLIVLYAASSFYHSAKTPLNRKRLRIFDHASIYVLIAGTYTPFTLITLNGKLGWIIFGLAWCMAISGIILKLFFTGKYNLLSTIMYVVMGWIVVFAIKPLINSLSTEGLFWLSAGGMAYTVGAVLYSIKRIPFNHAIFHVFVLFGSFSHFWAVFHCVIPVT